MNFEWVSVVRENIPSTHTYDWGLDHEDLHRIYIESAAQYIEKIAESAGLCVDSNVLFVGNYSILMAVV